MKHGSRGGYSHGCRCATCTGAARVYERDRRALELAGLSMAARLPAAPLLEAVHRRYPYPDSSSNFGGDGWQQMGGWNIFPDRIQRALYRAKKDGTVSVRLADEIAIAAGFHPAEIYGTAWWEPAQAEAVG